MTRAQRIALVIFGVGLAAVAWSGLLGLSGPTRALPDGSELSLRSVAFDRSHRELIGRRWLGVVGTWLPERLARRFGAQFVTVGGSNELSFWFLRSGSIVTPGSQFQAVTIDRHGCELGQGSITEYPYSSQPGRTLWSVGFKIFPRREPQFVLRILERATNGAWVTAADFVVSNPDRRRHPTWTAGSLPLSNRVDDVDWVLWEATGGVGGGQSPAKPWKTGDRPGGPSRRLRGRPNDDG